MPALQSRVNNQFRLIKSSQAPPSGSHAHDVLAALRDFQEMAAVQCLLIPLSHVIRVLDDAAPVYRKACPEPPGYPIHLSAQLLYHDSTLSYFPSLDILVSFSTGRPMHFRYDTTYTPELREPVVDADLVGLQWMNGVPNQFLVMLARMNMLLEDSAPNTDPVIVQELEMEIRAFKSVLGDSPDPYSIVARLMVHEAWRQVMYIYLYMGLCGAASNDPRVENALKKFVGLLNGVKPRRMPDVFLVLPLCAAGVAAHKQRDRDIIRQRLLGTRECSRVGTCGNDAVRVLDEVWKICDMRSRYARWIDRSLATARVTGII
ncbi:Fungal specific transcription factor domain [Ceratobasidium sp. AG-Ba]|nr:Fungal specific transcription factor domain [Ceratobasidium sp. AG-Ba]QRW07174.1 Fungal specific transcription factor domain [Ceratobasidium sp. AG-Ba]